MNNGEEKIHDTQVAHWEQHLASIIEKTNQNIKQLSRGGSMQSSIENENCNIERSNTSRSESSLNHNVATMSAYKYQTTQFENGMHSLPPPPPMPCYTPTEVVTRPIPKHVENDLTKRVEQSIRKSVERIIHEKAQNNQLRINNINDRLESLSDDFSKVQRERDILSRTLSTHERLSRRLKSEWESQRTALNQMESMMNDEKQASKEELDILMQRHTHDLASRVTVSQFKRAVETLSSKTRAAIEKTVLSVRKESLAELTSLREEMKAIKDLCSNLEKDLENSQLQFSTLLSSFNETHVKEIVGGAIQSHFQDLENNTKSNILLSLKNDMKLCENELQSKCIEKLTAMLVLDENSKENKLIRNIAFIIKSILDEKEQWYIDTLASSILTKLTSSEGVTKIAAGLSKNRDSNIQETNSMILNLSKRIEKLEYDLKDRNMNFSEIDKVMKNIDILKNDCDAKYKISSTEVSQKVEQVTSDLRDQFVPRNELTVALSNIESKFKDVELEMNGLRDMYFKDISELKSTLDHVTSISEQHENAIKLIDTMSKATDHKLIGHMTQYAQNEYASMADLHAIRETSKSEKTLVDEKIDKVSIKVQDIDELVKKLDTTQGQLVKSTETLNYKVNDLGSKANGMEKTVFDTIQSMNSLQLELSKTRTNNSIYSEILMNEDIFSSGVLTHDCDKINDIEQRIQVETSKLQQDFDSLQSSFLEMKKTSVERTDFLIQGMKNELMACKTDFISKLDQKERVADTQGGILDLKNTLVKHEVRIDEISALALSTKNELVVLRQLSESFTNHIAKIEKNQEVNLSNDISVRLKNVEENINLLKVGSDKVSIMGEKIKVIGKDIEQVQHDLVFLKVSSNETYQPTKDGGEDNSVSSVSQPKMDTSVKEVLLNGDNHHHHYSNSNYSVHEGEVVHNHDNADDVIPIKEIVLTRDDNNNDIDYHHDGQDHKYEVENVKCHDGEIPVKEVILRQENNNNELEGSDHLQGTDNKYGPHPEHEIEHNNRKNEKSTDFSVSSIVSGPIALFDEVISCVEMTSIIKSSFAKHGADSLNDRNYETTSSDGTKCTGKHSSSFDGEESLASLNNVENCLNLEKELSDGNGSFYDSDFESEHE